ncbi:MAG: A/G-specific adenine glycosylase [Thermoplasmata archaeon]|nr:A/G-specific adenine glycosylase [Thermoplasmata archaeon]
MARQEARPLSLLSWFAASKRGLPWRQEPRDPYRVWVSEVMLQQTRVETVLRYYEPFLARFPDIKSLAAAREDDLMKAWEGLGYYRRARLLQSGARRVVERHQGELPADLAALREIPGMGPYTAGAVASLAFGLPAPAVDGNVLRVWSRLTASEDDITLPATRRKAEAWVLAAQPRDAPGAFNEALMELGATVCTPKAPRCEACPLAEACLGRAQATRYPVKAPAAAPREMRVALALSKRGGAMLLEKRDAGLLAGTWGLPWVEVPRGADARELLREHVERLTDGRARVAERPERRGEHVFTHRRWKMEAYAVETDGEAGEWRRPDDVALGTAHRKLLRSATPARSA